MNCCLLSN